MTWRIKRKSSRNNISLHSFSFLKHKCNQNTFNFAFSLKKHYVDTFFSVFTLILFRKILLYFDTVKLYLRLCIISEIQTDASDMCASTEAETINFFSSQISSNEVECVYVYEINLDTVRMKTKKSTHRKITKICYILWQ